MPRHPRSNSEEPRSRPRPATTPEAREQQMIAAAVDLAEKQLIDGSASAQVISHYLKLGSSREKLEQERIRLENELSSAKTQAIKDQTRVEELILNALNAMKTYSGNGSVVMEAGDESFHDV